MTQNKLFLLLIFIFLVSELLVNPIGNFPLNDDWSYGKPGLLFYKSSKINIGDFPAMTLFTHLVWGGIFTKIFGFSFTVLRFSTLVSAVISMFFLNKLVINICANKITAFVVCLSLLFNPLYFNLCNTYMTDVNFNTLVIMCCYFAFDFFKNQKTVSFLMVFILSALLVLIRQFGIILPACFAFACVFLTESKWKFVVLAVVMNAFVFFVFKYYESFLKSVLGGDATYKFSGNVSITQRIFWDNLWINMMQRHTTVFLHVLLYAFPLVVIFIKGLFKEFKIVTVGFVTVIAFIIVYHVFKDERFPIGNIFSNMNVGAETFFETLYPDWKSEHEHTWSEQMNTIASFIKYGFILVTVTGITLMLLQLIKQKQGSIEKNPFLIFLACVFLLYSFLLFIPESFTDRYHIPLITITLIFLSFAANRIKISAWFALLPLALFFYVSVAGTKDYLTLNRNRWEAYNFLKNDMGIDHKKINGGFEVNCWSEGEKTVWYFFLDVKQYDFLIQYRQEKGFKIVREYSFQRYFPYKKDKIYIFANTHADG